MPWTRVGRLYPSGRARAAFQNLAFAFCLALLLIGCSQEEDPVRPVPPTATFRPSAQTVVLTTHDYQDFSAVDLNNPGHEVTWECAGQIVGEGSRYRYHAGASGLDTLTARVEYADQSLYRQWAVEINEPPYATVFEPSEPVLSLVYGEALDFLVSDRSNPNFQVTWERRGQAVAHQPHYRYLPNNYGLDSLAVHVQYGDGFVRRSWLIEAIYPEPAAEFLPAADQLDVIETTYQQLTASSNRSHLASYTWRLDGAVAGTDSSFLYTATGAGDILMRCEVRILDSAFFKEWQIRDHRLADLEMPEVEDAQQTFGVPFGEILISWRAIQDWYVDIEEYRVLMSYDGPITVENRADAAVLTTVSSHGRNEPYLETFHLGEDERLIPGAEAWFTIVGVDGPGNLSTPAELPVTVIPTHWYIEGTVRDVDGRVIANVGIRDPETGYQSATDATGHYQIGPFPDTQPVTLAVTAPVEVGGPGWYDRMTPPLTLVEGRQRDFVMIPRYPLDEECPNYGDGFLQYFRLMTTTGSMRSDRPNHWIYRWEEYPISIYVPEDTTGSEIDFEAAAIAAVQIWNDKMGTEILTLVDDPQQAQIEFQLGAPGTRRFGYTELEEPGGGSLELGAVVPEKVAIILYGIINSQINADLTALHELGHALGLFEHAVCNRVGYLMYSAPSVSLEDWPEHAIHPDEINAINAIRNLPQTVDMSNFQVY